MPKTLLMKTSWADADVEDRDDEVTGAVRLIASLASLDGAVLLTPDLGVIGFGVKLKRAAVCRSDFPW